MLRPKKRGSLERDLRPHRKGVELRSRIANICRAYLLDDVAMQIVEHQADIAVDVPVQRERVDCLPSARDTDRRGKPVIEVDRAVAPGDLPRAPATATQ